jgi:hypothetical protein
MRILLGDYASAFNARHRRAGQRLEIEQPMRAAPSPATEET